METRALELPFAAPAVCLVREVPTTYPACLRRERTEIFLPEARRQHAVYVEALRQCGARVVVLPADDACPDCCFIEDCAVVTGAHALVTRPGAPSRRAEVAPVAAALAPWCTLHGMEEPATLDGGDVLRVGRRLFVGYSERTNAAGLAALARVAALDGLEVVPVPAAAGALHLKSLCSLAGPRLLVHRPCLDLSPFHAAGIDLLPIDHPWATNCLTLGDQVLISADGWALPGPLLDRGLRVRPLAVAEFHKGDGALTCLSLRIPRPGTWTA